MSSLTLKPENIAQLVFFIRGEKVMLDADLATLIESNLVRSIKRSRETVSDFRLTSCFVSHPKSTIVSGHSL